MSKSSSRNKAGHGKSEKNNSEDVIKKEVDVVKEKLEHLTEKVKKNQYEKKEFIPDVYNDLHPYTEISEFILKKNNDKENGFLLRNTAVDLCDPWVDLKYDQEIRTDKIILVTPRENMENKKTPKQKSSNQSKEGSTHLPKYYVSNLEDPDLAKKELYFIDVPMLRKTLHDNFSINSTEKIDFEYTRTKQDFYRMGLDKLDEIHPMNRDNLKSTYYAYLQNNPGSKKAIRECIKNLEESKK